MDSMRKCMIQLVIIVQCMIYLNVYAIDIKTHCPRMVQNVFDGYAPIGNKSAGVYTNHSNATNLGTCVADCCKSKHNCNVAFVYNQTCYHVRCDSDDLCLPLKRPNITTKLLMVLVQPTTKESSWEDALKQSNFVFNVEPNSSTEHSDVDDNNRDGPFDSLSPYAKFTNALEKHLSDVYSDRRMDLEGLGQFNQDDQAYNPYDNDLQMEESKYYTQPTGLIRCKADIEGQCPHNEECIQLTDNLRDGVCRCISGYRRTVQNVCMKAAFLDDGMDVDRTKLAEKLLMSKNLDDDMPIYDAKLDSAEAAPPLPQNPPEVEKLSVSVISKDVQLPEREVTLAAYTIPDEKTAGVPYEYLWTLVSQPPGGVNGTMTDTTKDKIKLSNLSEGLYRFKVIVKGKGVIGKAFGNVSVLPEKRINKAPVVIVTPKTQIVKWPTSGAILDGSTSNDDDQIKSWHWDLIQGPIGYQSALQEKSTLQLTDLIPGNYTFKLTITDSDSMKNSTTAQINVLKANDYPPNANAGPDQIVYLPDNKAIINGSLSTDDREITSWEWTKGSSDESKAVDMQDTRTPYLKLSNLEKGMYTFVLKVTDASNQSSSDDVNVLVKNRENQPPVAKAGANVTINLPQNWAVLNATASSADLKIHSYLWKQLSGPNVANIDKVNSSLTNATGLTIGKYEFQVTVIDEGKFNSSDKMVVTIVQEKNTAPVARGGGDQKITLPTNSIYVNGTNSFDDLGIVKYEWSRDSASLAIGTIVGNTDHEAVLILTNIVPGRYVFKLTVTDAQGLTGTDTVSIIVYEDPLLMSLVELTFTVGVSVLTQAEIESLQQKMVLLLGDNTKLRVRDLRTEQKTGEAVLIFYVEKIVSGKSEVMAGLDVENLLIDKLWRDSSIIGTPISDVRTTICQNTCSKHGTCNSESRACMCETFWMPSIFYFWGLNEANCDWSIIYVVVGVLACFLFITAICWGLTYFCRRRPRTRNRTKPQKYSLLETNEHENPTLARANTLSDSETDSDVLFESKTKLNGILRTNGTSKNGIPKYATTRLGRRIKA